jgi:signal transduction histidine kinase
MPHSPRVQARLLQRTVRTIGLTFTLASLLCALMPGSISFPLQLIAIPFYAVTIIGLVILGASNRFWWAVGTLVAGIGALLIVGQPAVAPLTAGATSAIMLLAAGGLGSLALVSLDDGPLRVVWLVVSFVLTLSAAVAVALGSTSFWLVVTTTVIGWTITVVVGAWLTLSIQRALSRIVRLGRAHRAERHASETEAQRRQGARLLHDTVLATLTLLAHSGVGVSPSALREQASGDARLLRQLRLGGTPMPRSSGGYTLEATETDDLGHTLESVKQRFDRMGLDVSWHGAGKVLLPSDVLNAFLLSLAECLENVRRHAGVDTADVTITQDEKMVRAMVTDAGVGFEIDGINSERLGLSESVIARMRDVGGNTRLFSAPGAGTTVILEAPK